MRLKLGAAMVAAVVSGLFACPAEAEFTAQHVWPRVGAWTVGLGHNSGGDEFCGLLYGPETQPGGRKLTFVVALAKDWSDMRIVEDGPARANISRLQFSAAGFDRAASVLKTRPDAQDTTYQVNIDDFADLFDVLAKWDTGKSLSIQGGDAKWVIPLDRFEEVDMQLNACIGELSKQWKGSQPAPDPAAESASMAVDDAVAVADTWAMASTGGVPAVDPKMVQSTVSHARTHAEDGGTRGMLSQLQAWPDLFEKFEHSWTMADQGIAYELAAERLEAALAKKAARAPDPYLTHAAVEARIAGYVAQLNGDAPGKAAHLKALRTEVEKAFSTRQ